MVTITLDELKNSLKQKGDICLFLTSEARKSRIKEIFDVEVVAPELEKVFTNFRFFRINVDGVEKDIESLFSVSSVPALLILKDGEVIKVLVGIKAWNEYIEEFKSCL